MLASPASRGPRGGAAPRVRAWVPPAPTHVHGPMPDDAGIPERYRLERWLT